MKEQQPHFKMQEIHTAIEKATFETFFKGLSYGILFSSVLWAVIFTVISFFL
jgi:hypothetical protein